MQLALTLSKSESDVFSGEGSMKVYDKEGQGGVRKSEDE